MAKKQTRRCISINRSDYEAAKLEAARRGVTLAALVESGLAALGVPVVVHPQQSVELVQMTAARRAENAEARAERAARAARAAPVPRLSRERQVLGDLVADACGFA